MEKELELEDRVMMMKKVIERREREKRRNIIIKGLEVKEGRREEGVVKLMEKLGTKVEIEETKRLGGESERGGEMMMVKLRKEKDKWKIIKKKTAKREERKNTRGLNVQGKENEMAVRENS